MNSKEEMDINAFNNYYEGYNQWNNNIDVIKEEVQNENNPSSFDNLSNSLRFDQSTHAFNP